jgi:hypothetical protein
MKVIAMTATQTTQTTQTAQTTQTTQTTPPRSRFPRWVTAPFRAFWRAQAETAAAGGGYFLV